MSGPRLSVVIPARNEAPTIGPVIDRARAGGPLEIIVAVGRSADATAAVAAARGARVVEGEPGRGPQLNAGAAAATGGVLLFLHADTLLPAGYGEDVRRVLARPGVCAGAFSLRIGGAGRWLRVVEGLANWRARLGAPYGDQALFVAAPVFRAVGGYPDAAGMEDLELVRRLRRVGRIGIADACVVTSPRRWLRHGVWRTTLLNQACVAAYLLGVSGDRIGRWRGGTHSERSESCVQAGQPARTTPPPSTAPLCVPPAYDMLQ